MQLSKSRSKPAVTGAVAMTLALAIAFGGCGGGGDHSQAQVTPEAQKKTEAFLENYQKSMYDQHKTKPKSKGKPSN